MFLLARTNLINIGPGRLTLPRVTKIENKNTMKKYFVLAAAALVALTACTKMEVSNTPSASQKISFEVANYMNQTKADETSLVTEGYETFTTNAWYHSPNDGTQYFMKNVAINWKSAVPEWAPAIDYFWPKTGYVNFYSYAGSQAPTAYYSGTSGNETEGTLVYENKVIAYNDNILVADAAYGYNANVSTYHKDNASITGVPTLFRHYLSKLAFNVKLATTEAKKTATNRYEVDVLDAYVKVLNKGTLTLSNADPTANRDVMKETPDTPETQEWTNANTSKPNVAWVGAAWSEESSSATVEKIQVVSTDAVECRDMIVPGTLHLALNATEQTETGNALILLKERTVMPQSLGDNVVFYIQYRVRTYHNDEANPYSVETLTFGPTKLTTLVNNAIVDWNKNTKYTYNVIIDPVLTKITFDPAVEKWAQSEADFNPWLN